MIAISFVGALLVSLALIPLVRGVSFRLGQVAIPREDRWHRKPTPTLGGVGIYIATMLGIMLSIYLNQSVEFIHWGLLAAASLMFFLGMYDDFRRITPPAKLIGQILGATIAIYFGYTTNFFTARLSGTILAQVLNIGLTFLWLVGISNAINLLDNMDGLAGGISLITSVILSFFFWRSGDYALLAISLALSGAVLGFLVFNFPPASIFMGDSGSLFLGFSLAVLAIARQPQASNVFAILGVPTLIFLLPILDTTLVTITRVLRGQSPAQGGRDHTSHRLIAFGLTERQAVLALYGVALISGVVALGVETLDYWLSLVVVPALVLALALLTAYLGGMKVVEATQQQRSSAFTRFLVELTYRRRLLEIGLDLLLIGIAHYLAFLSYYRLSMIETNLELYLESLPIAYGASYLSFFVFGVYRGVWRYVGLQELTKYGRAAIGSILLMGAAVEVFHSLDEYPLMIFILTGIFLFIGLAITRFSFRILDQARAQQALAEEKRVLIYGAGDAGELAVRWLLMNPRLGYRPIGFLDEDPLIVGRQIHGIDILGGVDQLEDILESKRVEGVLLTSEVDLEDGHIKKLVEVCHSNGRWVRALRLDFELIE